MQKLWINHGFILRWVMDGVWDGIWMYYGCRMFVCWMDWDGLWIGIDYLLIMDDG